MYICIGKFVNTHGIKGEIRILSNTSNKSLIFKKGFKLYIGKDKKEYIINTYRVHKNYDMVTLEGIDNINDIIDLKGSLVYIDRLDIKEDVYFDEDFIGLDVFTDKCVGKVVDILKSKAHDILVIEQNDKKYMIPKIDEFIKKIDLEDSKIYIEPIEGMIDEN